MARKVLRRQKSEKSVIFQWSNKLQPVLKFSLSFPVECFSKHPQKRCDILNTTTLHFLIHFFCKNHVILHTFVISLPCLDTLLCKSSLCDQHENIFPCAVFSPGRGLAEFPQEKLKWCIKPKKMRPLGRRGKLRVKWT